MLVSLIKQNLMADTDPEEFAIRSDPIADEPIGTHMAQLLHGRIKRTDSGHDKPVAALQDLEIARANTFGSHSFQGLRGRMDVAGTVVENSDHADRLPFVLGTPLTRGSGSTA